MRDIGQEIRQALRSLRRAPGFTAAAVLTLGLALGAAITAAAVVHAVLWRALPFRDPSAVVTVSLRTGGNDRFPMSVADLLDYRERSQTLEGLAAFAGTSLNLTGHGDAERLQGMRATGNLFGLLGVEAALGRTLQPEDEARDDRVVVVTDGLWRRRFGADPGILGRALVLNGEPYTVVGVLPPRFPLTAGEVALPLAIERMPDRHDHRATGILRVVGRLRSGVSLNTCRAELTGIFRRIREELPESNAASKDGINVTAALEDLVGPVRASLRILAGAAGCVLLVACANLSGLALVRASGRRRELAVRGALGAGRARLARPILIEGLLLALLGGLAGAGLSAWATQAIAGLAPRVLPRAHEVGFDAVTLLLATGLALFAGLGCGLVPAVLAARLDLLSGLRGEAGPGGDARRSGRGPSRGGMHRSRRILVALETALAMVLLAGAGLLLRSFVHLVGIDPGFERDQVLVARLALPKGTYGRPEALVRFHDALRERLRALPGVRSAGLISIAPMSGPLATADVRRDDARGEVGAVREAHYRVVSPDYFATMGIGMHRGRPFTDADREGTEAVGIVNETLARRLFADGDPVGRALFVDDTPAGARRLLIVGVVADIRHEGLDLPPAPDLFLPVAQVAPSVAPWIANNQFWSLRADGDPTRLAQGVRASVRALDPDVSAGAIQRQGAIVSEVSSMRRLSLLLVLLFAGVSLLLAALGLYGVVASTVRQRRREIGIRIALGARGAEVTRLVASEGLRPAATGLAAGLLAAWGSARLLAGLTFGIDAHDPATFAFVALALGAAASLACWLPARAATRIPPTEALRAD